MASVSGSRHRGLAVLWFVLRSSVDWRRHWMRLRLAGVAGVIIVG